MQTESAAVRRDGGPFVPLSLKLSTQLLLLFSLAALFFFFFRFQISPLLGGQRALSKGEFFQTRPFSSHAIFRGGSSLVSNSEASSESQSAESGCQPQRLARLEERREEDDIDDDAESNRTDHVVASASIIFRGSCSPRRGEAPFVAPSAVAFREDEPPRGVAATEVARRGRRKRKRKHRRGCRGGEHQWPLIVRRAPPSLVVGFAARPFAEGAAAPGTGVGVGARVRRKQQRQQQQARSRRSQRRRWASE